MLEDTIGMMVPIFGIFMIIAVVVGPIWIRSYYQEKERQQLHETLRVAYEKGQPPPPELIDKLTSGARIEVGSSSTGESDLRRAVVLIAVGLGLAGLGFGLGHGIGIADHTAGWIVTGAIAGSGAIPGMIGIAYLLLWLGKRSSGPRT
jgi:hypothetical protein